MEPVIRDASRSDLDATATIIANDSGGTVEEWRTRLAEVLDDPSRGFLVAVVEGEIVGFGQMRLVRRDVGVEDQPPSGWYLSGVTVAPGYRRRGIGVALTRARLDRLQGEVVYYAAEPDNEPTIRLHERLGFQSCGQLAIPGGAQPLLLFRLEPEPAT